MTITPSCSKKQNNSLIKGMPASVFCLTQPPKYLAAKSLNFSIPSPTFFPASSILSVFTGRSGSAATSSAGVFSSAGWFEAGSELCWATAMAGSTRPPKKTISKPMMMHLWLKLNFIPPYHIHEWDICRRKLVPTKSISLNPRHLCMVI